MQCGGTGLNKHGSAHGDLHRLRHSQPTPRLAPRPSIGLRITLDRQRRTRRRITRRIANARTKDRWLSTHPRPQLEPDEQECQDVDEDAGDRLDRRVGSRGARLEVIEAVPHCTGEDAAAGAVVQPGEHDRAASEAEHETDVPDRSEATVGGDREEVGKVSEGPDRSDEQGGGESTVPTLQQRQRETTPARLLAKGEPDHDDDDRHDANR